MKNSKCGMYVVERKWTHTTKSDSRIGQDKGSLAMKVKSYSLIHNDKVLTLQFGSQSDACKYLFYIFPDLLSLEEHKCYLN